MATARDLISAALRSIGVLASGEAMTAAEGQDALATLNDLLDSWRLERLLVYALDRETLTLVPGTSSYTVGTGGVLNITRPVRIEHAVVQGAGSAIRREIPVLGHHEYLQLAEPTRTATEPSAVYYDATFPLATLIVYPVPTTAAQVVLSVWRVLSAFATLDATVSLPPGYARALRTNLAAEMCPEYGRPLLPEIAGQAAESKESIKRHNAPELYLELPATLTSRGGYTITTDETW
jgi:hypothetical protein